MTSHVIRAADLFCGAGGTSTGLARAAERLGVRLELLAVNHWETAVETHAANHPWANHACAALDSIDPTKAVRGKLDLLVASPECTHHSSARGGKPMSDQSRSSAFFVLGWVSQLLPRAVLVENVQEFRTWGPLGANGRPIKSRAGETYQKWIEGFESLGYRVEARVLNAADYGDPTTRRRLFIVATRAKSGPVFPEATHTRSPEQGTLFGARQRWRAAREVIDWSFPSRSIFDRKRPLADATLRRIEEGLRRFGGKAAEPFLTMLTHGGRVHGIDAPLPTITTANRGEIALVEPFMLSQQSGGAPRGVSDPVQALATKGAVSLVEPFMVPHYTERPGQTPRTHGVDDPIPTIPATNQHGLVEPYLVRYHGTGGAEAISAPVPTITTKDRFGLVEPDAGSAALDIRFRMLQPHELAAAMSFPSNYKFSGNRGDVVRQIGNAVPVKIAEALCGEILERILMRRSA